MRTCTAVTALCLLALSHLVACGSDDASAPPDASDDGTTPDATHPGHDASGNLDANGNGDANVGADADVDANVNADAGADAVADAGADAVADARADAVADARVDAVADAGPDASTSIDPIPGVTVATLAGSDVPGSADGTGAAAQFTNPTGVALEPTGNLVVAEYDGNRVRRITPAGVVTTLVAPGATFVGVFGVAVSTTGTLYAQTDYDKTGVKTATSGTVWRITPAIDGGLGAADVVVEGLGRPRGLAAIASGNLFAVDRRQSIVGTIDTTGKTFTALAGTANAPGFHDGNGAAALFDSPLGAATLGDGSVLVADWNNNRIRRVTAAGDVTTYAGDGTSGARDGARLSAQLSLPSDVAVDGAGNVYVADTGNHRVRRISAAGLVQTVAGDGTQGFANGAGTSASFYGLESLDVTADGKTVYVSDGNSGDGSAHHRVRVITIP